MSKTLRTLQEVINERKKDTLCLMYFVASNTEQAIQESINKHNAFFKSHGLETEQLNSDFIEKHFELGQIDLYYVDFDDMNDVRVAEYNKEFETAEGLSLLPDLYRMYANKYEE